MINFWNVPLLSYVFIFHVFLIFSGSALIAWFHAGVIKTVIIKYISTPLDPEEFEVEWVAQANNSYYQILVSREGKASYLNEPVWAKGYIHLISYHYEVRDLYCYEVCDVSQEHRSVFNLAFTYSIRLRFDVYTLVIRLPMRVGFTNDPSPQELYEKMLKHDKPYINSFLLEEFERVNNFSQDDIAAIKLLADYLLDSKISREDFFERVKTRLVFPEKVFSAISGYSFIVGAEDILIDT